jgi:hypothetical protein
MILEMLSSWMRFLSKWITKGYEFVFPEFPKIGIAVLILSALFLVYYACRGRFSSALKMSGSILMLMTVLLYAAHLLIKIFKIVI